MQVQVQVRVGGLASAGAHRQATTLARACPEEELPPAHAAPASAPTPTPASARLRKLAAQAAQGACLSKLLLHGWDPRARQQRRRPRALSHHITSHQHRTTPHHTILHHTTPCHKLAPLSRLPHNASFRHFSSARPISVLPAANPAEPTLNHYRRAVRRLALPPPQACVAQLAQRSAAWAPVLHLQPSMFPSQLPLVPTGIHGSSHQSATAALLSRLTPTSSLLADWVRLSAGPSWMIPTADVRAPAWGCAQVEVEGGLQVDTVRTPRRPGAQWHETDCPSNGSVDGTTRRHALSWLHRWATALWWYFVRGISRPQ